MDLAEGRYRISEAFEVGGVMYYQFDDAKQIPADRAMAALTFYEEMNQRCTREYLEKHCKAVDILLKKKSIGLQELVALRTIHNNLMERLNLAPHPEQIWKYASVTFFDANESPYMYDAAYNRTKIETWKTVPGLLDFFLTLPMLNLMQHLGMPAPHFHMYLEVADMIKNKHQNDLHTITSNE